MFFIKNKKIFFFVSIFFIIKVFLATYIPLINDEAYAIAVSKQFSLSFFDHPPLGFLSSQIFPKIFRFENEVLYRLPFILYGLATSIVLYETGKTIQNHNVGIWSVIIYNLAPFYFFSGGFFVVPDGPLNLGITLVGLSIIKLNFENNKNENFYLILLGFSLALCFGSKYQGFLIGLGCLLVLIISKKRNFFLKNPYFYLCLLIAIVGLLPTIIWNHNNDWISFKFQGSRQENEINPLNFVFMLIGLMIYLLPQTLIIPLVNLYHLFENRFKGFNYNTFEFYLILLALPNIFIFTIIFMTSDKTFPHWIIPGWLLIVPIFAKQLIGIINKTRKYYFLSSAILIWGLLSILIIHSQTGILSILKDPTPKWDNTLELINWKPLKKPLQKIIESKSDIGRVKLAAFTWTEAGQISTLMDNKFDTVVIEGKEHHFQFLIKSEKIEPTILVKLSLGKNPDIISMLKRLKVFDKDAQHIQNVSIKRGSKEYATASLFLFKK